MLGGTWLAYLEEIDTSAKEMVDRLIKDMVVKQGITEELKAKLESIDLNDVPFDVVSDVICFCTANKKDNTDWVHLPVANFDCYYSNTNFSKKWLSKIPDTILEREVASGICRVNLKI